MIKQILDEIANEPGSNKKMEILGGYTSNDTLRHVLYNACSKRIKFFIKQLPEYTSGEVTMTLEQALIELLQISSRIVTGGEARELLVRILSSVTPDDAHVIERIIEKDLKIGMGTSNINKVYPELIEKTGYMGCKPFKASEIDKIFVGGKSALSEVKADGRFSNAVIRGGIVELESRQGEEVLLGDCTLMDELSKFDDCVLNGEFVIDGFKRETSNGIMTSIISITKKLNSGDDKEIASGEKSKEKLVKEYGVEYQDLLNRITYIVWDILNIDDYFTNSGNTKRVDRLNNLIKVVDDIKPTMILVVEHKYVHSAEEALEHFAEVLARGEEGTVLKTLDGLWRDGKRYNQIKMKVEFHLDLKITGFNYGSKGTKNEHVISSVQCESSDGILITNAQGITEELMVEITENQDEYMGAILQIKCNGLSSNSNGGHSVLYPSYEFIRSDKTIANSFEECVEIDASAKGLKTKLNL